MGGLRSGPFVTFQQSLHNPHEPLDRLLEGPLPGGNAAESASSNLLSIAPIGCDQFRELLGSKLERASEALYDQWGSRKRFPALPSVDRRRPRPTFSRHLAEAETKLNPASPDAGRKAPTREARRCLGFAQRLLPPARDSGLSVH